MILADTAIWIGYFRNAPRADADHLASLIEAGKVATCGPVLAELLAGATRTQRPDLLETLLGLPWADLGPNAWLSVGDAAASLRRAGRPLPLTDLTIAVAAAHAGYPLWSLDADFERIVPVLDGLQLYEPA